MSGDPKKKDPEKIGDHDQIVNGSRKRGGMVGNSWREERWKKGKSKWEL